MQKLNQKYINSVVKKALDEDLKPRGDITTNLVSFKNKKSKAKIIAKQNEDLKLFAFTKKYEEIFNFSNFKPLLD